MMRDSSSGAADCRSFATLECELLDRCRFKLSHMALSYASPTEPIEGRTPASRQRWPNSIDVYCGPWSE